MEIAELLKKKIDSLGTFAKYNLVPEESISLIRFIWWEIATTYKERWSLHSQIKQTYLASCSIPQKYWF